MQLERWEKVKYLFNSVRDRPVEERNAYLDAACAGDLGLRKDVEAYLDSQDRTVQFKHSDLGIPSLNADLNLDPRVGKKFDKYLIRQRLGEGGMGIVYLATDTHLGREVAIKILPESFSRDSERLTRFRREARATSLLNHPNIVTIHELGQLDSSEYIVTEYVEGETLRKRMLRGPMDLMETLRIGSQVASALSAAHRAGIIHRDIKPENVMLRPDGYVKILDFGLAKLTDQRTEMLSGNFQRTEGKFIFTMPGVVLGTVAYMSPEQAEGLDIDGRTDIWGLGVLLYEMVAGKLPFEGTSPSHTMVAILEQPPLAFECQSTDLKRIILKALEKDRSLRYQSATDIFTEIDQLKGKLGYLSDQNITNSKVEAAIPAPYRRKSPYRKLLWIVPTAILVLSAFAAASIVGIYYLLNRPDGSSRTEYSGANTQPTPTPAPMPTSSVEEKPIVAAATPTPTPMNVYVEPTPVPIATPVAAPTVDRIPKPVERPIERPKVTTPTQVKVEPRPTPRKPTTKPPMKKQDPNCVFTNSCH